jgi:hypothetical protein
MVLLQIVVQLAPEQKTRRRAWHTRCRDDERALVLAAGGLAGIAWETGILRGIADTSPVR